MKEALSLGIIDADGVSDKIMLSRIEQIKKKHSYALTPPSTAKGRWQTFYKGSDGIRKNIKAQTEEELWKKLIPIYFDNENIDNLTFFGLYKEWLDYKKSIANSLNTIKRHEQHYRKYFESSVLHVTKIKKIDDLMLETECNRIVREFVLTQKEWSNIKTILIGVYELAIRKKYISVNPMEKVKILVKFKQVVRKTGKTETYNSDELKELNKYLDAMYVETNDTAYLAVKLNFMLGLRVGELVSVKWEDLTDLNHIHIVREEVRNQVSNQYEIVDHTKTNRDRFVVLIPKVINILQKLERTSEYIFARDRERITSRQIAYILEKYAERKGLETKSTHKRPMHQI